jgi:hypothetical protein
MSRRPESVRSSASAAAGAAEARPRRVVASFPDYAGAERAVDQLADARFPVERVSIVGRGLKYVEQVTGRMGWLEAAVRGALTGAVVGGLIGWLFWVFDWYAPIVSAAWLVVDGIWFGAIVGLIWGLIAYAVTGGRRDFSSVPAMVADQYDVVVDADIADEAERILHGGVASGTDAAPRDPTTPR